MAEPRRAFRHRFSGQLGFLQQRHGKDMILLDRPAMEIWEPFDTSTWIPEKSDRVFNRGQIMRIAYEADRALCHALGLYGLAGKEWQSLKDQERIDWIEKGPTGDDKTPVDPRRLVQFNAIVALYPNAK